MDEHGERLYALLVRLTLRTDVAEELMQDLFCKLAQDPRCLEARSPAAYAMRMAANLAFDYRRNRRRAAATSNVATLNLAASHHSPLADLLRHEELDRVLDAVGRLPPEYREAVVLRYLEQQDYATIAGQLGRSAHHIRAMCHKAITQLRGELDPSPRANRLPKSSPT